MEDLISIIVPIYRVEQYLDQCIWSIRNQTYRNLEIILVDDGSDDMCPEICDRHAKEDDRIIVIHKENGGLDSARKAGMRKASGKYVGYVDGDDWIESVMYEKLLCYAHEYDVDIVESGVIDSYIGEEKERKPYLEEGCYKGIDFIEKIESKLLYAGVFFEHGITPYTWSKIYLRERIMKYQMMAETTNLVWDDTMVTLPCIAQSRKLYISHDSYYHYRVRSNSLKRKCRENEVPNLFKCYKDFYKRFEGTKLQSDKQIKFYMMYWLLFKAPYVFDDLRKNEFLVPFGNCNVKDKIVLYGAGAAGIHLENYVRGIEGNNMVCWMDRNYKDLERTMEVRDPKEIIYCDYDYVIIAILRESTVQSARKDLVEMGVPKEKIRWIEQKYIDDPDLLLGKVTNSGEKLI